MLPPAEMSAFSAISVRATTTRVVSVPLSFCCIVAAAAAILHAAILQVSPPEPEMSPPVGIAGPLKAPPTHLRNRYSIS